MANYLRSMLLPWLMLASAVMGKTEDASRQLLRGSALVRTCQAEVRLMDLPSLAGATQDDLIEGSYCVGFVNGFVGTLQGGKAVCTNGAPVGEVIRAYVAYMEKNPKLLEQDRRVGLRLSLQEIYPCPITQEPRLENPGSVHARTA